MYIKRRSFRASVHITLSSGQYWSVLTYFMVNMSSYVLQLWFALDNGFSGQILFDKWCIGIYNVVSFSLLER